LRRVYEHKNKLVLGFTKKYDVNKLVWLESHDSMLNAITREKQLKEWKRKWKCELIEKTNPYWIDLYNDSWF